MSSIYIYNLNFELKGIIDDFISCMFTHRYYGVGEFEIHVHKDSVYAKELIKNRLISIDDLGTKVGIIRTRNIKKSTDTWVIKGYTLKGIVGKRITYPRTGSPAFIVAGPYETIMKEMVKFNCINPDNPKRKINSLVVATDQQRGVFTTYDTRYKNLDAELEDVSKASGLGWDITMDIANKQFTFDLYKGIDRTSDQKERPPVVFSIDFENINDLEYTESYSNYRNVGLIGGQGDGAARTIFEVGDSADFDREEVFIDARDIETQSELPTRGKQKLDQEYKKIEALDGEVITTDTTGYVFGENYFLGDWVTVQDTEWNIIMDTPIIEVEEVWEGGIHKAKPVFGSDMPTVFDAMMQEIRMMQGGVKR